MTSYVSVFRSHLSERTNRPAVTFMAEEGSGVTESTRTYRELDARARSIAAHLDTQFDAGSRVLLLFAPGLDFVDAFLGALMSGVVAVPAPVPDGSDKGQARLAGIATDAGVSVVLTSSDIAPMVQAWAATLPVPVPVLAVDTVTGGEQWSPAPTDLDSIAFLQYTSGSTSDPKGVVVTHRNLLANEREIEAAMGHEHEVQLVGWLPPFHDMGLIGMILYPLFTGGHTAFMSPLTFLKRPVLWLEAMHRMRATYSVAPNFAFDFVARRVSPDAVRELDLSSMRSILNGSEPIVASSMARFTELLAPSGLRDTVVMPAYGLAEATLLVTMTTPGTKAVSLEADIDALADNVIRSGAAGTDTRTLVGSGHPITAHVAVAVVDPDTGKELADAAVGEIWVHGDSVARGYWNMPDKTADTFDATLRGTGGWLRTGDLGAVVDGELFVTGRIKDMIIVNGRNLYSHDIELSARTVSPAVAAGVGASFTVGSPERLVLVHEIKPELLGEETAETITDKIREVIRIEHSAPVADIVLVAKGAVARTTSGKIRRAHMRGLYESSSLQTVAPSS